MEIGESGDPEIPVMSWENARDKMNSSRAFMVNPVYLGQRGGGAGREGGAGRADRSEQPGVSRPLL